MSFSFYLPTRVLFGEGALIQHGHLLGKLGRRALVVTGRHSARASGTLDDFADVAKKLGLSWVIFNEVPANPSLDIVAKAVDIARQEDIDLVIGIGGGSPLDTAKVQQVLTGQQRIGYAFRKHSNFCS
ncbi:MAG: iron-containing alcohol dehydrogenase [Moorella sp. (in: Bacteria)]|nr:iron-containing alcohol dehydrogenase [Moorella sp. (in: firmicutes)]